MLPLILCVLTSGLPAGGTRGAEVVTEVAAVKTRGTVTALAFSPGGTLLAVAASDRAIHLLAPEDGRETGSIPVPQGTVYALAFSANGQALAGGLQNELAVWESATGKLLQRLSVPIGRIGSLSFSTDGKLLAAAGTYAGARVFDTREWREKLRFTARGTPVTAVDFAPAGNLLAGVCGSRVLLWDDRQPAPLRELRARGGPTCAAFFAADGETLVSGGSKGVAVWEVETGKALQTRGEHKGRITALAVSGDRKLLASAAEDKTIFLRTAVDAALLHRVDDLPRAALCVALNRDATRLACGMSAPGTTFMLWRLDAQALYAGEGTVVGEDIEADYLSRLERAVVAEHNLARANPRDYAAYLKQLRQRYQGRVYRNARNAQIETKEGVAAVDEAIAALEKMKPMPPLAPSKGMSLAAQAHVEDTGPAGIVGHAGSDGSQPADRVSRYGQWLGRVGENISFGVNDARAIVVQLIVDDGVPDRGHRRNIFTADYRVAGVHVGPHRIYGTMCVITYAGGYKEKKP